MVNFILFKSSFIFGTIQLLSMFSLESRNLLLNTSTTFGILTSIVNHGTTSDIAKWTDRCMMLIGIYVDICVIETMHVNVSLPILTDSSENEQYLDLDLNPYLSSTWERDLYYIYYHYICYYFLSLSIISFIISKYIERSNTLTQFESIYHSTKYNILSRNSLFKLSLSFHIVSHLLLSITHILLFYHI